MKYMQRLLSVTGYSPSELVHAHPLRLPPPVDPNHPSILVAAVLLPVLPEETFIQQHHARSDILSSQVHDHILKAEQRNADKQARLLASHKAGRGRKLQPGDLAYVIERGLAKKHSVTPPFVVESSRVLQVDKYICVPHTGSPTRKCATSPSKFREWPDSLPLRMCWRNSDALQRIQRDIIRSRGSTAHMLALCHLSNRLLLFPCNTVHTNLPSHTICKCKCKCK